MEVRATAGDTFLGGENFDDVIIAAFMEEAGFGGGASRPSGNGLPVHGAATAAGGARETAIVAMPMWLR